MLRSGHRPVAASPRSLLVIVSDLFTDLDAVYDGLNRLRFHGHEVLIMQVLDRDELELPFDGPTIFQDIEGDEELFAEAVGVPAVVPEGDGRVPRGRACAGSAATAATTTCDFLTDEPLGARR